MRKYMPVLVLLVLLFSFVTVASAAEANETQERTDCSENSQEKSETTGIIATTDNTIKTEQKEDVTVAEPADIDSPGGDCCSAVIQGYMNDSTISFRRDDKSQNTINISKNSSILKQSKGQGSYIFNVIIGKEGWLVGNGGTDSATISHSVEKNTLTMINARTINEDTFESICDLKSTSTNGHYIIKAPNGSYALYIHNNGTEYKEYGVLSPGQFLCVPNDPDYFIKGEYKNYTNTSQFITSSRLIAAMDKYGVDRRIITTYYLSRGSNSSLVRIYAYNDDGKYVNRTTGNLTDNIRTSSQFISASTMRTNTTISKTPIETVNFTIEKRKLNTTITSDNITTNSDKVTLKANVVDEYGNIVNKGFVSLLVDGRTVKYANGSVVYADVVNGTAQINHTIPNIWNRKNHTYYFRYYGRSSYESNLGSKGIIFIEDLATLKTSHAKTTIFGTNLTITTKITYTANSSAVDVGHVLFKVNGKTIRNEDNSTLTIDVVNGTAVFNLDLDYRYSAKVYKITVVFGNGAQRIEKNSTVKINKIPTSIESPKTIVRNNTVRVIATLVDMNDEPVEYYSFVSVKINGLTLKDENNSTKTFDIIDGVMDFRFKLPTTYKVGKHTLTLVVPELRETLGVRKNVTMVIK